MDAAIAKLVQAVERRLRPKKRNGPVLRFRPTAWAKLLHIRDLGPTEIGGFGVVAEEDPLLVEEFHLVRQETMATSVRFEDESVADYVEDQADKGVLPGRSMRVWIHTHPGEDPTPSPLDEETFERCFQCCDWSVMAIVARSDATYARLHFHAGPGGSIVLPVEVDYSRPFGATDHQAWKQEYHANVTIVADPRLLGAGLPKSYRPFRDPMDEHSNELFFEIQEGPCPNTNDLAGRPISSRRRRSRRRRSP